MHHSQSTISRRAFIQASAIWTAALALPSAHPSSGYSPRLSFSTLGCPDWDFNRIVDFAASHQYQGLEIRGIQRELDLPKSAPFKDTAAQRDSLRAVKSRGLRIINLGSSATLHFPPGKERDKQLEEGRRFIDLAHALECPYVRIFPNNYPRDQDKQYTLELIISGLKELVTYAKGSRVGVLLETHGDLVYSEDLAQIMEGVADPHVGLIWDIANMWMVTRESPSLVYSRLKTYIRHSHIKDARFVNGQWQYCFLGKGEVPIFEGVELLARDHFKGFFSFEWEKLWHPEIADPEWAFADYRTSMRDYFSRR